MFFNTFCRFRLTFSVSVLYWNTLNANKPNGLMESFDALIRR